MAKLADLSQKSRLSVLTDAYNQSITGRLCHLCCVEDRDGVHISMSCCIRRANVHVCKLSGVCSAHLLKK